MGNSSIAHSVHKADKEKMKFIFILTQGSTLIFMYQEMNDFEYFKLKAEELYKSFDKVYCPYFKGEIFFNSFGLEHLKFKKTRKARLEKDQHTRFKLLHLAPVVISLSNTIQGIRITKSFEEVKINTRRVHLLKEVTYYEFIAVIKNDRVRIIIKQIENGDKFFWSVIPAWQIDKNNMKRILYTKSEED
jgi:hypothetical protein